MDISNVTERLILATLSSSYSDKVLEFYNGNKEHFEPWEPIRDINFYTIQYQKFALTMENQLMKQKKMIRLYMLLKEKPSIIIGSVNFYNITSSPYCACQIGYKIDHKYTRSGYAYEGIRGALEVLSEFYPIIHRIEANIMPTNTPSISLIEKLGFTYEGIANSSILINNSWEDHIRYSYIFTHTG